MFRNAPTFWELFVEVAKTSIFLLASKIKTYVCLKKSRQPNQTEGILGLYLYIPYIFYKYIYITCQFFFTFAKFSCTSFDLLEENPSPKNNKTQSEQCEPNLDGIPLYWLVSRDPYVMAWYIPYITE